MPVACAAPACLGDTFHFPRYLGVEKFLPHGVCYPTTSQTVESETSVTYEIAVCSHRINTFHGCQITSPYCNGCTTVQYRQCSSVDYAVTWSSVLLVLD